MHLIINNICKYYVYIIYMYINFVIFILYYMNIYFVISQESQCLF